VHHHADGFSIILHTCGTPPLWMAFHWVVKM
jgi:hypothetical protein